VLSRTQIFESVSGYDFGPESNGLWVYMSYLRRKMGEPRLIQTERSAGARPAWTRWSKRGNIPFGKLKQTGGSPDFLA
jgi:hypothetical protein